MYRENENPVFAPWTPDGGGGPPCLWEFGGHLYEHRWLDPNVRFLRQTLNPQGVNGVLSRAVERLCGLPEHEVAAEVQSDIPLCAETLAARCAELPRLLDPPARAHQQTGQLTASLSAGRSGPGHGTQPAALAQQVLPPRHAPGTKDREGSDGPKAGGSPVLDVAPGWDYGQFEKLGSYAGELGNRQGVQ
jgi:hypothetical protein